MFKETTFCTMVLIDVHDTSCLKLRERDVLIKDEGLEAIWKTVGLLYCKMISNPALANGLGAHHPLRVNSPYPIPRPSAAIDNLAGTRWMPKGDALVSATGDRLERQEIISIALDRYGCQEGGYLESMLESSWGRGGCPEIQRVLFQNSDMERVLGEGVVPEVTGNTLIIKAEGDELQIPLDDGESGYALTYSDVGSALNGAELDDLYNTVVEDLALRFTIDDPKGKQRCLPVPVPAIYFSADEDAYWPFVMIAKGHEDEAADRMLKGVPWNNEEEDYDPQERSARETYTALVAKVTGQTRSHFQDRIRAAIAEEAYSLTGEMNAEVETLTMTVVVRLKNGGYPTVAIEAAPGVLPEAA